LTSINVPKKKILRGRMSRGKNEYVTPVLMGFGLLDF
jgi:hypothetical protein